MKKSARNSLVAGLGIAAVGSILVAQKRKRSNQASATSGYPDYGATPAQGGAGDEPQGNIVGTMTIEETIEEMTIKEKNVEEELGKALEE